MFANGERDQMLPMAALADVPAHLRCGHDLVGGS